MCIPPDDEQTASKLSSLGKPTLGIVYPKSWRFPQMIISLRHSSNILLFNGLLVEISLHNENVSYYRNKMKKESFILHEKTGTLKNGNTVNHAESQAVIKAP